MIMVIGLIAGVVLPLWNIPLILRIRRRRSSADISLYWAVGVWSCFILMFPSALQSSDIVFKVFSIANLALFSFVVFEVLRFRKVKEVVAAED